MNVKKIFGENLKRYRKESGLTQEKLSEMLDISPKHLSNIEVGIKFVSADLIETIYQVMEISPSGLFYSSKLKKLNNDKLYEMDKIIDQTAKVLKGKIREF